MPKHPPRRFSPSCDLQYVVGELVGRVRILAAFVYPGSVLCEQIDSHNPFHNGQPESEPAGGSISSHRSLKVA